MMMQSRQQPSSPPQPQGQQRGGVLYITDPPPNLDFGIDCMNYETGAKFRGVCMIPKGIHFVYHSTGMGSRQGFFLFLDKDEIVVKCWDSKNEEISAKSLIPEASLRNLLLSINNGQEDQYLGPYPLQQHSSWLNLSNYITSATLHRAGLDFHTPIYPGDAEDIPTELLSEKNQQAVTSFFPDQARVAQFCDVHLLQQNLQNSIISSECFDSESKTRQLSQMHLDNSLLLESVVSHYFEGSWEELLAEIQLSFVLFMLIFSFPALQQWKLLINLVCKSERVLVSQPNFTASFIRLFFEQLQYSPDDFFETEISTDNFLKPALSNLFESLDSQTLSESLDAMRKRLFTFVQKKFNLYLGNVVDVCGQKYTLNIGSKFNLVEEDMPVLVMPDNILPCAETMQGNESRNEDRKSEYMAGHHDSLDLKSKWDQFDKVLGVPSSHMETEIILDDVNNLRKDNTANDNFPGDEPNLYNDVKSNMDLQENMFCWRYPMLYDEMTRHNRSVQCGREDLTMTAVRVMESVPPMEVCDRKGDEDIEREARTSLQSEAISQNVGHTE